MSIAKKLVYCTFPKNQIKEPILYNLGQYYKVIPNIRGASITDEVGLVYLELEGEEEEIERAVNFLRERLVKVDDVHPDPSQQPGPGPLEGGI
jgi:ABC-type methionine transport system ATPase subunit